MSQDPLRNDINGEDPQLSQSHRDTEALHSSISRFPHGHRDMGRCPDIAESRLESGRDTSKPPGAQSYSECPCAEEKPLWGAACVEGLRLLGYGGAVTAETNSAASTSLLLVTPPAECHSQTCALRVRQ
jgi:hypothetical protein